ncbi:MAG: DNA primase [Rikenellaceae bacterium]|nr:DNA primase [Rikenellaceae bacterium]
MIDQSTVDRIYAAADIVEVVSDFVNLRKKGVNYQACCPFHEEKTPSFVVSPSKGVYKCFGCGKGGNAVSFVMEHENLGYVEALRFLGRKYGIEVEEREQTDEDRRRNDDRESMMVLSSWASDYFVETMNDTDEGINVGLGYFRERAFSEAVIKRFGLGYCPSQGSQFTEKALTSGFKEEFLIRTGLTIKRDNGTYYDRFSGRVMFPIHSISGRVIAFGGRTLRTDKKTAKYLNSPESEIYHKSNVLYGLFFAKKAITKEDCCILVEGYTDVLSLHQSGVENVVASSGTSLTVEQIRLISRFTKNITVIYDGDSAGIKASLRGIDMILREGLNVRVVPLPENEDPDSFARGKSSTELREYIRGHEQDFISFKTKLLSADVGSGDPIKRAAVISDIVDSLSVIPEAIPRNIFIRESSTLLGIDEALLVSEVSKRRRDKALSREETEFLRKREKNLPQTEFVPVANGTVVSGSGVETLEYELISYLLRYGMKTINFGTDDEPNEIKVAEAIIGEMKDDGIELQNSLYRNIYTEFVSLYDKMTDLAQEFPLGSLTGHPDPEICNTVVDVMMRTDLLKPSGLWERNEIAVENEEDRLHIAVPRAITLYKTKIIENMIKSLSDRLTELAEFNSEAEEILKQIDMLNQTRKHISEKFSRILL